MHLNFNRNAVLCSVLYFLFAVNSITAQLQNKCIDLGTGIGVSNEELALIDFFKNGGSWEILGDNGHEWYKVYNLDSFKIVNGSYYHWDIDWSGTVNNERWGDNWADCYISYWDMMVDQGKIRPDGYPVSIPAIVNRYHPKSVDPNQGIDPAREDQIVQVSRRIYFPEGLPSSGWILKWKGAGTIRYQGIEVTDANIDYEQRGNSWTPDNSYAGRNYEFTSTDGGRVVCNHFYMVHGWVLEIVESDPTDPIHDIVFLYPGLEDEYDAGQRYHPLFLERMRQFKSLRYMGYLNGNNIEGRRRMADDHPYYYADMIEYLRWEERTPENYYEINNGNGGNYEYIIELSNLTGTDPWVNIPYCAGPEYTAELVELFMAGLDPDLTLYLEVGNEMWNFAPEFNGFFWQAAMREVRYPGLGDVEARGAHINSIFKQVTETAGNSNLRRIVRVFAGFPRYTDVNNRTLNYIEPQYWDAFATTWYFNISEDNSDNNECKDPVSGNNWKLALYNWWEAHPNDQQGFNEFYRDAILSEFRCSESYATNSDAMLAKFYNKKLVCYEGGNHSFYGCENAPNGGELDGELEFDEPLYPNYITNNGFINAVCVADESDEMGEVFDEIIDSLQAAGYILANHLSFSGRSSCYGVWELIQSRDLTAPLQTLLDNYGKFRVFSERIQNNNCDQVYVTMDADTVGPGLCVAMDGFDDYIQASTTFIPREDENYTLEAWVKPNLIADDQVIFSFSNDGSNDYYNLVKVREDGLLVWEVGNNETFELKLRGPACEVYQWFHLTINKNGNRYTLYKNGVNVASANASITAHNRNNFTLGALQSQTGTKGYFGGDIDEVRLWNTSRSLDDIRTFMCQRIPENYPSISDLQVYYRFDIPDYEGSQVYDRATQTYSGAIRNMNFTARSHYTFSGAALGDYSNNIYPNAWNGVSLNLIHPDGDRVGVTNMGEGSPQGVHIYMFDGESHYNQMPAAYSSISDERVIGVFMANGNQAAYNLNYIYSGNPDAPSGSNEVNLRLLRRDNYGQEFWYHSGAELDAIGNALVLECKEAIRGEYTLALRNSINEIRPGSGMALQNNQAPTGNIMAQIQYLHLDDFTITFWAKGWGEVFNFTQKFHGSEQKLTLAHGDGNIYANYRFSKNWSEGMSFNTPRLGTADEWHHYALTRQSNRIIVYCDGMQVALRDNPSSFHIEELYLMNDPEWQTGNYPGSVCNLTLDEVSVWDIALDQETIREWMCKKINDEHPYECENLVLHFNFDEGLGNILEDHRGPSDIVLSTDGSGFSWVYSGAALGDESISNYTNTSSLSFSHPDGDYFHAIRTDGAANGIHLYRIDNRPPDRLSTSPAGIESIDSSRYWGMFTAIPHGGTAEYTLTNFYENNSQLNLLYEEDLRFMNRTDNSDIPWNSNLTILPDEGVHSLTLINQTRGEYILGGTSENAMEEYTTPEQPEFLVETADLNISEICGNSSELVYRVEPDPQVVSYIWNLPVELAGFSNTDSIIITANYNGISTRNVSIEVTALNAYGESTPATYNITLYPPPSRADAGPDQILLPPALETTMDGNSPQPSENALWALSLGTGIIAEPINPQTLVSAIGSGTNRFTWTISNALCPPSIDTMQVLSAPPPIDITLVNGDPLPAIFCEGDTVILLALPPEDIIPDQYVWNLPDGLNMVSQTDNEVVVQIGTGIGGIISVSSVYAGANSESFESQPVGINLQPSTPIFEQSPSILCMNVNTDIRIRFDASIDSVVWMFPDGIYPTEFPRSTTESIEIEAIYETSGFIKAQVFNDGCTNSSAADSFAVATGNAPDRPMLYLGTDGGTADPICRNENVLLWVENEDPDAQYEWRWDTDIEFIRYFNENNAGILLGYPGGNSTAWCRAIIDQEGCNTSEWFEFNGWVWDESPSEITALTITDPPGQPALNMQLGEIYTIDVVGTGDDYYWNLPEGFEIMDDGNLYDNTNQIRVASSSAGSLEVYPITLEGCSGEAFEQNIGVNGALLPPEYLSGNTTICQNSSLNITVSSISGATSYRWTLPDGSEFTTTGPVLNQVIDLPMKGNLQVIAFNMNSESLPAEIPIRINATTITNRGFIDQSNNPIDLIEVCNGDRDRPIYHVDGMAGNYTWDILGTAIETNPRWEPGHEGDNNYQLLNRSMPTDTMMPVSWVDWRCNNDGADGGYIRVTMHNECGGADVIDSIRYIWVQPLNILVPEFTQAPTILCVGSSVNYEIEPIPNAVQYIWNLPSGINAPDIVTSLPSITAEVVNGAGGFLTVRATSDACSGSETIDTEIGPITISGDPLDFYFTQEPAAACPGDILTYTVNDIGAPAYIWQLPDGLRTTLVDDADAGNIVVGSWNTEVRESMVNSSYQWAANGGSEHTITYTPELPHGGNYRVSLSYFDRWDTRNGVPVTINHATGSHTQYVNMQQTPENGIWHNLGEYEFEAGIGGNVVIGTSPLGGNITIADAVRFELLGLNGGTSLTLPSQTGTGGAVCVSIETMQCENDYTICTQPINLTGDLEDPLFTVQTNSVCEGNAYTFRVSDIGADSYTWYLPEGMNISGQSGIVTEQAREVVIAMESNTGRPVRIGVQGILNSCALTSDTSFSGTVLYNGMECQLMTPVLSQQTDVICVGSTETFSVNPVPFAEEYEWTIPPGLRQAETMATGTVVTSVPFIVLEPEGTSNAITGQLSVRATSTIIPESNFTQTTTLINIYSLPEFSVTPIDASQCGTSNGRLILNGLNPLANYEVGYTENVSPSAPDNFTSDNTGQLVINGLNAATYSDIVVSREGCSTTDISDYIIDDPDEITIESVQYINPEECGSNGQVKIALSTIADGTNFSIDFNSDNTINRNGSVLNDTITLDNIPVGSSFSGLSIIQNNNQCMSSIDAAGTISDPTSESISSIQIENPIQCDQTGTLRINMSGAVDGDTYSIDYNNDGAQDNTGTNAGGTIVLSGIAPNTSISHPVLVNLNSNCRSELDYTGSIVAQEAASIDDIEIVNPTSCTGTGSVIFRLSSANEGDSYSIILNENFGNEINQSVAGGQLEISGLSSGALILNPTIENTNNNCISTLSYQNTITSANSAVIDTIILMDPVACESTGTIQFELTGNGFSNGDQYSIDFTDDGTVDLTGTVDAGAIYLNNISAPLILQNPRIVNTSSMCASVSAFSDTLKEQVPAQITDIELSQPESCGELGGATIYLDGAEDGIEYTVDFTGDGIPEQQVTFNTGTITLNPLPGGTILQDPILVNTQNNCESAYNFAGQIVNIEPAIIQSILIENPQNCNDNGEIAIELIGAYEGDIFEIDYNGNGSIDCIDTLEESVILIEDVPPGTQLNQPILNNVANQCQSGSNFTGEVIATEPGFEIGAVNFISPANCDEYGEVIINVEHGIEGDSYSIDLNSTGEADYELNLENDQLTIEPTSDNFEMNGFTLTNLETSCSVLSSISGMLIAPNPPEVILAQPVAICANEALTDLDLGYPNGGTYWINGNEATQLTGSLLGSGSHQLIYTYTDDRDCMGSDTVYFEIANLPDFAINGPTALCPGAFEISYQATPNEGYYYQWNVESGEIIQNNGYESIIRWNSSDTSSRILLTALDPITGCSDSVIQNISFSDIEPPIFTRCVAEESRLAFADNGTWIYQFYAADTSLMPLLTDNCSQSEVTLSFTINNEETYPQEEFVGFTLDATEPVAIRWLATDISGNQAECISRIEFEINSEVPSAFSPNEDQVNDTWEIDFLLTYPSCEVKVYNRWGNQVYQSERGYPVPWDGKVDGKLLPVDTYYYIIDPGEGAPLIKGNLTIMY